MCGFTLVNLHAGGGGGSAWKLLFCFLLFVANISDESSCLQLINPHSRPENLQAPHTWQDIVDVDKMTASVADPKAPHKHERLYDKDLPDSHLAKSNASNESRVHGAKSFAAKRANRTRDEVRRVNGVKEVNGTHVTDNATTTLRLGYANDPFGDGGGRSEGNDLGAAETSHEDEKRPSLSPNTKREKKRTKRGVVQLYNMVSCATGCDPLIYKGYGCYCGFLGSGRPVDGIDRCCKMHDICYDVANCPMYLEYVVPYYWKCHRGKSLCAIDHLDLGGSGSCAQRLCECDRLLSECLSRFPCPIKRARCVSSPWRLLQNTLMIF